MDFRDRKAVKGIEFNIQKNLDNLPIVLYHDADYSRMNDDIIASIKREVVILPLALQDYFPLLVVAKDYASGWNHLCETLQTNMVDIVNKLTKHKKRRLNVDALARSLNKFKATLEEEEGLTLQDFHYVTGK